MHKCANGTADAQSLKMWTHQRLANMVKPLIEGVECKVKSKKQLCKCWSRCPSLTEIPVIFEISIFSSCTEFPQEEDLNVNSNLEERGLYKALTLQCGFSAFMAISTNTCKLECASWNKSQNNSSYRSVRVRNLHETESKLVLLIKFESFGNLNRLVPCRILRMRMPVSLVG